MIIRSYISEKFHMIDFVDNSLNQGTNQPRNNDLITSLARLCPDKNKVHLWSLNDEKGFGDFQVYFDREDGEFVILAEYPNSDAPSHFNGITLSYSESGSLTQYFTETFKKIHGIEVEGEVPPGAVIIPDGPIHEQEVAKATGLNLVLLLASQGTYKGIDKPPSSERSR